MKRFCGIGSAKVIELDRDVEYTVSNPTEGSNRIPKPMFISHAQTCFFHPRSSRRKLSEPKLAATDCQQMTGTMYREDR